MEIVRLNPETVTLRDIDPFAATLIRRIPVETDPGNNENARKRLFSKPMEGREGGELNEEWKLYVEPELSHLFQSATETVTEDLKNLTRMEDAPDGEETYALDIPMSHLEQWLNALNQARLVLAARNTFTDEELAADYPPIIQSTRERNLLQIHFYALLQEFFIREIG